MKKFLSRSSWIRGPEFLWKPEDEWPVQECTKGKLNNDDNEVRSVRVTSTVVKESGHNFLRRLERFSSWRRVSKTVAFCLKFGQLLKNRIWRKQNPQAKPLDVNVTVDDLQHAELQVIKLLQEDAFPEEREILLELQRKEQPSNREFAKVRKSKMKRRSSLYRLDPFLDQNGVLRVGGRLRRAYLTQELKNPLSFQEEDISPISS